MSVFRSWLVLSLGIAAPWTAWADDDPPLRTPYVAPSPAMPASTPPVERRGAIFGIGLGVGDMVQYGGPDLQGGAVNLHIGRMITPRFAVLLDSDGVQHTFSSTSYVVQGVLGASAQRWLSDNLWLKGTAGVGFWTLSTTRQFHECNWLLGCSSGTEEEIKGSGYAPALALEAGYDLTRWGRTLISAELRGSAIFYSEERSSNLMLMIAVDFLPDMH